MESGSGNGDSVVIRISPDPSTSSTLIIYPLDTVRRCEVYDSSTLAFWSKSSVDIEPRRVTKVQDSFARILGYCEQTDIHSPMITIYESLIYFAFLRLPKEINITMYYDLVWIQNRCVNASKEPDNNVSDVQNTDQMDQVSGVNDCDLDVEEDYYKDEYNDLEYVSIQRPAFCVTGEPDFHYGPPQDGLKYLRRVK
nr:gem-associated protein 2 [Tanacetum cinerariifolium]